MSAAAPLQLEQRPAAADLCPVTLADIAPLRAELVAALGALDDLLWPAGDATSAEPVMTVEAQRLDIDRHGSALRALLQLAGAKVDGIAALVRLADDERRRGVR